MNLTILSLITGMIVGALFVIIKITSTSPHNFSWSHGYIWNIYWCRSGEKIFRRLSGNALYSENCQKRDGE